jgi:hypothetical protein
MTIVATHFAVVLGAWRLRIRVDIDEPREAELRDETAPAAASAFRAVPPSSYAPPGAAPWGRG